MKKIMDLIFITLTVCVCVVGIIFIFYAFIKVISLPSKINNTPQCQYYKISVFGEDKYAGQDYELAKEMASGKPVYLSRFKENCNTN